MTNAARLARAALVATVLLEAGVLAGYALNYWRARGYSNPLGTTVPVLEGYGLDYARGHHRMAAGCVLVRVVSRNCAFCREEQPGWKRLDPALNATGCVTALLLPGLRDAPFEPEAGAAPELIWVPLDWAHAVNLLITPTTIVVNRGKIAWVRSGTLGPAGFSALQKDLPKFSSR